MRFTEWVNPETDDLEWLIRKDGCMHCADPGCLKACPAPGAIVQYSNGIVDFIHENCIGCGYCVKGCPFNIPRISQRDHKAYKCTLCSDRVAVGQGPACVKACPTQAIVFGTKEDMKKHAAERIADLKSRGYPECRPLRSAKASAEPMSCMCCTMPTSRRSTAACQTIRRSAHHRGLERRDQICRPRRHRFCGGLRLHPRFGEGAQPRLRSRRERGRSGCRGADAMRRQHERPGNSLQAMPFTGATRSSWTADTRVRGSTTGSRRRALFSSRCPAWRCSTRNCSFSRCLFGGGQTTRMIHPWIGVVLFFSFLGLFLRFWKLNLWKSEDGTWPRASVHVLAGNEERLPESGKYNAGQKFVFWAMSMLILILISSGIVIWDQYLRSYLNRAKARRTSHPCDRRGSRNFGVDHPCLCRDLGARHDPGHDLGLGHWRLGVAASSQMVARSRRKIHRRKTKQDTRRIRGYI